MPSTVTAKMNTCNKTNKVTATLQDDGTIKIDISSNCPNVKAYAEKLTYVTAEDVVEFSSSKVVDPEIRGMLSVPCLTPIAVFDAAWLELGMLSKSKVRDIKENSIIFEQ